MNLSKRYVIIIIGDIGDDMEKSFEEKSIDIDEKGLRLIGNAKKAISLPKTYENRNQIIEEAMDALYDHFSTYSEEKLRNFDLQIIIFGVERLLKNEYLPLNNTPIYDSNNDTIPDKTEDLLDYIIHCTRKIISKYNDLEKDSLEKTCPYTSSRLEEICSSLKIETIHLAIGENLKIGMFHEFTIIRIPQEDGTYKNYLADCTYRQFFTKQNSNPRRIGVMRGPAAGSSIGAYMMMTERRKEIAETILTKGYIELTPEVFKEFFDSIMYSFADKEYYVKRGLDYMNPNDVIPPYTIEDYLEIMYKNRVINEQTYLMLKEDLLNKQLEQSNKKKN